MYKMTVSILSGMMDWLIERGFLVSPDLIDFIQTEDQIKRLKELVLSGVISPKNVNMLSKTVLSSIDTNLGKSTERFIPKVNDVESKFQQEESTSSKSHIERVHEEFNPEFKVEVITNYQGESIDRNVQDFVKLFNARFKAIEKIISSREQITSRVSIGRLKNKTDRETVSIIGMVDEISFTKNGHMFLTLEDDTGSFKVLINKDNKELLELASDLTLDEIIGVKGVASKSMLYASEIIWPEVPIMEFKKSPLDEYAIFLSDFHFGSNYFMKDEFNKFIKWIRGETGNANQREIARKVKYVFIVGDLVDGVGIYPNQENELEIKDIYEQYRLCSEKIKLIPKNKAIIICPGNHDALRLSEPQPALSKKMVPMLYEMKNTFMVSNPALVNIGKVDSFSGFNVLMYHGYSFDYYIANIDKIRNNGGYDKPELIMKFLLRRRHLAPTYGSTLYVPEVNFDPLVISEVPDIFATGHIHKSSIKNYRNITMICGSCWQAKTSFQEKVGHHPEPCRVPLVHLNTRKIKILKFTS